MRRAFEEATEQINALKEERQTLVADEASLTRIAGYVENFEAQHDTFVEDHKQEFEDWGLKIDEIVSVTFNRDPLETTASEVTTRLAEIQVLLDGKPATETEEVVEGLEAIAKKHETEVLQF